MSQEASKWLVYKWVIFDLKMDWSDNPLNDFDPEFQDIFPF